MSVARTDSSPGRHIWSGAEFAASAESCFLSHDCMCVCARAQVRSTGKQVYCIPSASKFSSLVARARDELSNPCVCALAPIWAHESARQADCSGPKSKSIRRENEPLSSLGGSPVRRRVKLSIWAVNIDACGQRLSVHTRSHCERRTQTLASCDRQSSTHLAEGSASDSVRRSSELENYNATDRNLVAGSLACTCTCACTC